MTFSNKRMALVCAGLAVCNVLVAAAAQAQDVSFEEARNFAVGYLPSSVAVGDFNGDGRLDLAVANWRHNNVSVLLGNGDGSFQPAQNFFLWCYPRAIAVGDFNGDGRLDLAAAGTSGTFDDRTVSVLLGNGDGSFQPAQNIRAGWGESLFIAVGDFNGDLVQDLVTSGVSVLLGNGDGSFQPAQYFTAGAGPASVAVGDFNRDGVLDLAVAGRGYDECVQWWKFGCLEYEHRGGSTSVLLGRGDGTFGSALRVYGETSSIVAADFNGDDVLDLAVPDGLLSVLLGNGDGTFQGAQRFEANGPGSVTVGDFNDDGLPDLAVISLYGVSVLLGNGDGSFQGAQNFGVGRSPSSIAVGDFNGDGLPDLAVANWGSDNVSVLINNTPR